VRHVQLAREIGEEDDARLQRRDQERLARPVVVRDLVCQLCDPVCDLLAGEVPVADPGIGG
jgi:hypothetical protein